MALPLFTFANYIILDRNNTFMNISIKQEKEILDMFSSELENGHEWSMQDVHEQIRKIVD